MECPRGLHCFLGPCDDGRPPRVHFLRRALVPGGRRAVVPDGDKGPCAKGGPALSSWPLEPSAPPAPADGPLDASPAVGVPVQDPDRQLWADWGTDMEYDEFEAPPGHDGSPVYTADPILAPVPVPAAAGQVPELPVPMDVASPRGPDVIGGTLRSPPLSPASPRPPCSEPDAGPSAPASQVGAPAVNLWANWVPSAEVTAAPAGPLVFAPSAEALASEQRTSGVPAPKRAAKAPPPSLNLAPAGDVLPPPTSASVR